MTPDEATRTLLALPRFAGREGEAFKPGLGRIRALLSVMGNPHEGRYPSAHVAGSHGKGTVSALVAAVGTAAGRRVGLHTSPHLLALTERMRLGYAPAPGAWLAGAVQRHRADFERVSPSFFEATVALSLLYFAEKEANAAVVEVGLGGRLDATNVLQPAACAITAISLEHTSLLGHTLAEVAREKAGIFKKGVPAVVGALPPEAQAAASAVAAETGAPLHRAPEETTLRDVAADEDGLRLDLQTPVRRYRRLRLPLYGRHQAQNARVAVRLAELFYEEARASEQPVRDGLAGVRRLAGLRGRFDVLGRRPLAVADVAHHPDSLAATLQALRAHFPQARGRLVVAFGLMRDKDAARCAALLAEAGAEVWPVALGSERALAPKVLAETLRAHDVPVGPTGHAQAHRERFRAEAAGEDALLVCGSHQVVAQLGAAALG